jgi:DNA-binding IclR family transcriptional regulator
MTRRELPSNVVACLADRSNKGLKPIGADAIASRVGEKRPTVNRYLAKLVMQGSILREGAGPATTYRISVPISEHASPWST